jgi:hypothetical protein
MESTARLAAMAQSFSSRSDFSRNNALNECTKRRSDFRTDADAISDQHFLMIQLHERRITLLALLHCEAHRIIPATSLSSKLEKTVPEQFMGKPIVSPNPAKIVVNIASSGIRQEHNWSDLKFCKPEL